jgi:hypothetical protein
VDTISSAATRQESGLRLRVYAHTLRCSEEERERLQALVEDHDRAHIGHKTAESASAAAERDSV